MLSKNYLLFLSFVLAGLFPAITGFGAEPAGQVIGYYSEGRLTFASYLVPEGKAYVQLFPLHNRGWGSKGLVDFIQDVALEIHNQFPDGERLKLGDLSAENGGLISGHASHQNGLDVDFGYFQMDRQERASELSNGFSEYFVIDGKLSRNFDLERNWEFLKRMVASDQINRIFVDPVIKNSFCDYAKTRKEFFIEVLRRLRPWKGHANHWHIRLTCPVDSPQCVAQEEIPEGSGCETAAIDGSGSSEEGE